MNRSPRLSGRATRHFRPLVLAASVGAALFTAPLAFAQDAVGQIEQQMTAEQFKAAGLDQLDAGQLANLNSWLNRTLDAETTKAAQQAVTQTRKEVEGDSGGFLDFGPDEPLVAKLQGRFDGFAQGRQYTLDNGQVWRQTNSASLAGVQLDSPQVTIDKSLFGGAWYLTVEGYNTRAKVVRVK